MTTEYNIAPQRRGFVVNPPERDEVTNEYISEPEVYENTPFAQEEPEETFTDVDEDALAPEDREPISELELGEISIEIHDTTVIPDETLATEIAAYSFGDTPSDITVQFLAHKVYQGELTAEEAFSEALDSGINPDYLAASYRRLKEAFPTNN